MSAFISELFLLFFLVFFYVYLRGDGDRCLDLEVTIVSKLFLGDVMLFFADVMLFLVDAMLFLADDLALDRKYISGSIYRF